jgi:hypothetical protein
MASVDRTSSDDVPNGLGNLLRAGVAETLDRWLQDPSEEVDLRGIVASLGEKGSVESPVVLRDLASLLGKCDYITVEGDFARIKLVEPNRLRTVFEAVDALLDRRLSTVTRADQVGPSQSGQTASGVLEGLDEELARQRAKPPVQNK